MHEGGHGILDGHSHDHPPKNRAPRIVAALIAVGAVVGFLAWRFFGS